MFRTTKNQHAVGFILNFFELDKKTLQLQKLFSEQLEMPLENIDYKYKGVKLNQISKIGFIPQQTMPMTKETIPIYIYDLGTQFKNVSEDSERVKSFQFPNKISGKIQDCCGVAVKEMWEIGKNTYYLKLQKALNFDKYLNRSWDENIFKSVGTQFQFIWNSNTNISRSTTYEPPQKHYLIQFIHSLRPITVFKK